jgi:8-oxo-dGTP diphosphatase
MAPPYHYEYPRPAVTVDVVAFGFDGIHLKVLLIRRREDPFKGEWALPGGFLEMDESPAVGALRELSEETGLSLQGPIWSLGFYGDPDRDPRGWTISLVFVALIRGPLLRLKGSDDAESAEWVELGSLDSPTVALAFDHRDIIVDGYAWLIKSFGFGSESLHLLPEEFGLADVRKLHKTFINQDDAAKEWLEELELQGDVERIPGKKVRYRIANDDMDDIIIIN